LELSETVKADGSTRVADAELDCGDVCQEAESESQRDGEDRSLGQSEHGWRMQRKV